MSTTFSISIGINSGKSGQGQDAIAIGSYSGQSKQGT
jgi:hypothetical protein